MSNTPILQLRQTLLTVDGVGKKKKEEILNVLIEREVQAAILAQQEHYGMILAAISTASLQNTEATRKDRISSTSPYWTVAYSDVCRAVDREMDLRKKYENSTP